MSENETVENTESANPVAANEKQPVICPNCGFNSTEYEALLVEQEAAR